MHRCTLHTPVNFIVHTLQEVPQKPKTSAATRCFCC